jgi:ABC-type Na+ efflux pump permease subunit
MLKDVNVLTVITAALSAFILGGVWYSLFGKAWQLAEGLSDEKCQKGHKPFVYFTAFLLSILSATAFSFMIGPKPSLSYALSISLVISLGFITTSLGVNYLFAQRHVKLFLIDSGYHIVKFITYGIIFGISHKFLG